MKVATLLFVIWSMAFPAVPQESKDSPRNEKAQKTFKAALQNLPEGREIAALEDFKKADKQDDGHCLPCQKMMIKYGSKYQDWKTATLAAEQMVANAQGNQTIALAHYHNSSLVPTRNSPKL